MNTCIQVKKVIEEKKMEIQEKRYRTNTGILCAAVLKALPWSDTKIVKDTLDSEVAFADSLSLVVTFLSAFFFFYTRPPLLCP